VIRFGRCRWGWETPVAKLHERVQLRFQVEAFNALNAPQLGAPSTSLSTTAAGQVGLTPTNDLCNYQIAAKILF
jgi:hypothetical protein